MPLAIAPGRFAHHTVARHPDKLKSPSRSDLSSPRTEASVEHPRTGGRKVSFSPVELSSIEGKSPTGQYCNDMMVLECGENIWVRPEVVGDVPIPRSDSPMAYDQGKGTMVLYGGWRHSLSLIHI